MPQSPEASIASSFMRKLRAKRQTRNRFIVSCLTSPEAERKDDEAEIENTRRHGQTCENLWLWQNFAPQSRFQPLAPQ